MVMRSKLSKRSVNPCSKELPKSDQKFISRSMLIRCGRSGIPSGILHTPTRSVEMAPYRLKNKVKFDSRYDNMTRCLFVLFSSAFLALCGCTQKIVFRDLVISLEPEYSAGVAGVFSRNRNFQLEQGEFVITHMETVEEGRLRVHVTVKNYRHKDSSNIEAAIRSKIEDFIVANTE